MSTRDGQSRSSRGWLEATWGQGPRAFPDSAATVDLLTPALDFLEISKQKWTGTIKSTIRESLEELADMNRVCFSLSSQNSNFDTDDPKLSCAPHENFLSVGNRRKIPIPEMARPDFGQQA